MNRATPKELREAMVIADAFVKSGVGFVPMPALSDSDYKDLAAISIARLNAIEVTTNDEESKNE